MDRVEDAVRLLRTDPTRANFMRESYLDGDLQDICERFFTSGEWVEVRRWVDPLLPGATVLDVGAGTGMASVAFARSGAERVYALEPDPSADVGRGAIALVAPEQVKIIDGVAEKIPLAAESVDIVYARQVLHHTSNLLAAVREFARVLRPGGLVIATREHVVDDARQLQEFLSAHPIHQLVGNENAFPLNTYLEAFRSAELEIVSVLDPWSSVINAFPAVTSQEGLADYPERLLRARYPRLAPLILRIPGSKGLMWRRLRRPVPGRMYSFIAQNRTAAKPRPSGTLPSLL